MNTILFIFAYALIGLGIGIYIQHDYPDIPFYVFVMITWPVALLLSIILEIMNKFKKF